MIVNPQIMMNSEYRIKLDIAKLEHGNKILLENTSLSILPQQQILLTGLAGSGKTTLAMAIAGQSYVNGNININFDRKSQFSPKVIFVPQHYSFKNKFGLSEFYYQQRYNSYDSEDTINLNEAIIQEANGNQETAGQLIEMMHLSHRINAPLIQLSSGERKKLQLILALLAPAQVMILDNPYIGLDVASVNQLNQYLTRLGQQGVTFIIISDPFDIPEFVTHVVSIDDFMLKTVAKEEYIPHHVEDDEIIIANSLQLTIPEYDGSSEIIRLNQVTVKYGDKLVLDNISWLVERGDKWLLSGHNGAGKSTLLSLISGDNPQAYANELYLFGKRRGSGETIWDIKRKIGFISPELHWSFAINLTCLDAVISGFFDTPGLYTKALPEQIDAAKKWLEYLGLFNHANERFGQVSIGVQRMVLLIRALVKNPPLFIFDEPCQGLDEYYTRKFTSLIDELFADSTHTIIYISHRADQIPKCINKTLKLSAGRIITE